MNVISTVNSKDIHKITKLFIQVKMLCNKMSKLNMCETCKSLFPVIALVLIANASLVAGVSVVTEESIAVATIRTQTSVEQTVTSNEHQKVRLEDEDEVELKSQCVDILSFDETRKFIKLCPTFITPPGCTTTKEDISKKYPACCPETVCP